MPRGALHGGAELLATRSVKGRSCCSCCAHTGPAYWPGLVSVAFYLVLTLLLLGWLTYGALRNARLLRQLRPRRA